jgi:hypothetical protein
MADLTDEQLLKRATHAGRNLSVLALLASVVGIGLIVAVVMVKGALFTLGVLAASLTILAVAYWFLAVAAYRGDPKAVGIVIVICGINLFLNLIAAGVGAARSGSEIKLSPGGFIIPIVILIALASSRKVLLQLQERGLWERVFAPAKPTARVRTIGLVLIIVGFVTLQGGMFGIGWKVGQQREAELRGVTAFTQMLSHEEQEFLKSVGNLSGDHGPDRLEKALAKVNSLEERITRLKAAPENGKLTPVLATYGNAVRQWKNGLIVLQGPAADPERAQKLLNAGDKLRSDACEEFKRQYGARQRATTGI